MKSRPLRAILPGPSPYGSWLLGPERQSPRALRVRIQTLLTVILVVTNLVTAALVVPLTLFVLPRQATDATLVLTYAIAVPVYVALAIVGGIVLGTRIGLRTLRWVTRGADPTEAERTEALRLPWRLTLVQVGMWAGALVVFVLLAVLQQPERAVSVGLTLGIATVVSGSIAYLLVEFALRPVAALALADDVRRQPLALGVGLRQQVFWLLGTGMPVLGLMMAALLTLTGEPITTTRFAVLTLVIGGVVLAFGGAVNALNARSVVAPITSVRVALMAVQEGDLEQRVPVFDGTELGLLQAGFNQMTEGLREREHIRDLFGRHVGQEVAAAAAAGNVELGGETRVVTVLFVDLVASTGLATEKSPAEVVDLLNRFFDIVVDEIDDHGGLVNKFMGDAVLGIFGAPTPLEDHPGRALSAARAISRRMADRMPDVRAGIGVYTGETVAGNVGTRSRFEYTVIGDAVNAASRLTELAKTVDPMLLTSWETVEAACDDESARWQRHDSVTLRGRSVETVLATCREP